MLARERQGFRVHVSQLPPDSVAEYLGQIRWPGDVPDVQRVARDLSDLVDRVVVCLDADDDIRPQLGLECFFNRRHGLDRRWPAVLDYLVARGLCAPSKRHALLTWPGVIEPVPGLTPWPDGLIAESLLQPADCFGVFDRRLSHVKISCAPERQVSAKAYFGYMHCWWRRNPERALAASRRAS
jgi:hypothetical protein